MRHDIFLKTGLAAARLGKTRREVVIMLLRRIMCDIDRFEGGFTLVKYQPRDPLKQWHCFPITFRKGENEFVTDFRKLGKVSVSYLVAIAAERYLEELLKDKESRHNYVEFTHYAIGQRVEGGIICWELYWGDPGPTLKPTGNSKIYRRISSLQAPQTPAGLIFQGEVCPNIFIESYHSTGQGMIGIKQIIGTIPVPHMKPIRF
jgi:hypothetical protein